MRPLAIYVHVPFCVRKCAYCDFASFAGREGQWHDYFEALGRETEAWADALRAYEVRSVFFGGGTPSLVPAEYIAMQLDRLRAVAPIARDAEITLEANPGTLTAQKLDIWLHAGVNRLSLGVQSFDDALLKRLGRIHSADEAEAAVHMARRAGFGNISLDLMYALPEQSLAAWRDTLDRAAALPVRHISAYSLIVEPDTEMARRVARGEAAVPDEDLVNEMQRMATARLHRAGLERYEISNYARAGFESRHNMTYWTGGEYLGLGSAAHSLLNSERFENPPELARYISGERRLNAHALSTAERREEAIMLETRTCRGLDMVSWRQRFGDDFERTHPRAIAKLERYGLIELTDGCLRLTEPGMELQDSVALELMDEEA